ncbi:ATP-binding cassette domain-containing protein [Magnetospirillum sulfuroxidans]|uniref:ATP-binding cassette domain-containing protein n=1 Tax=Magnetospirillum sulfuroxidans TaxID=611300 RepID=A0ABS5IGN4_9PROT|nr:ATP-binding cassette domain-containing protein [Magnetospirillum sulfuroxidans]MBR9973545.1 ATP-binding cassette domain-containing protein [Magnetospirillum sulfuroxidans]
MSAAAAFAPVRVEGLSHYFGDGASRAQVLFDLSLEIEPGSLVILTGPSGSGKTTLLTLMGALRSIQDGRLEVLGTSLSGLQGAALTQLRRDIGFIFQMHNLFDSLTALQNLIMATHVADTPPDQARRRCLALLERLGLGHRIDHKPAMLSGGQRQRVAVARALVNAPRLILADEPTAALDQASGREVVTMLREFAATEGRAVVMVTHDNRIIGLADRIMSMVDGRIVSDVRVNEAVDLSMALRNIDLFARLSTAELTQVAEKMTQRPFRDGEVFMRQGEEGDLFYLLRDGQAQVIVSQNGSESAITTLGPGQYFGERALITGEPRNATVVGRGDGRIATLSKQDFQQALRLAPDLPEQLTRIYFGR